MPDTYTAQLLHGRTLEAETFDDIVGSDVARRGHEDTLRTQDSLADHLTHRLGLPCFVLFFWG